MSAVVADCQPQPLKRCKRHARIHTHTHTSKGKVRYIKKSIGWYFCESAVSGHSCATSGVSSTMPFTALKLLQKKNAALINRIS